MKILLQRVSRASVRIQNEVVGAIDQGLLLFVGFGQDDTTANLPPLVNKVVHLRVFADDRGRFDRSLLDTDGAVLVVPQFTLYADIRKGRRPDFSRAMAPATGADLFDGFVDAMRGAGVSRVETGRFGADMQVELINDGPVTLLIE